MSCPNCGCAKCRRIHPPKIRSGAKVRLKKPKRGQTHGIGLVQGHYANSAKEIYVIWPGAWAGYVKRSELEIVR